MNYRSIDPPRIFEVGRGSRKIQIKDCARIELKPEEQVTFMTEVGGEYDVVRKSWGFYATPSLNSRLEKFGLRAVLVRNSDSKFYVLLVEKGKETDFQNYLYMEKLTIIHWFDNENMLESLVSI